MMQSKSFLLFESTNRNKQKSLYLLKNIPNEPKEKEKDFVVSFFHFYDNGGIKDGKLSNFENGK